ncbi:MAG TPA: phosphohistidine phosphatase SixA [Alcanivoracaceae bacterium]|nr:phosphohistidine phosphatase SixA [Alcanivoracaceae bacterium]
MKTWYVSRHGEAEAYAASDAQRALTERGSAEVREFWRQLREQGVLPTRIIASPYVRAQQTAAIIAEVIGGLAVETHPLITPDASVSEVLDWLGRDVAEEGVLLVSHMPLVGNLVGQWTQGVGAGVGMSVATVACIEADSTEIGSGQLKWLKQP